MKSSVRQASLGALETLVLDNGRLRAIIVPTLGGRVWELEDLERRRQWIWHREGVEPQAYAVGTAYDAVWAGGWEELFPNDASGQFEGRELPDHGEWWATAWQIVERAEGEVGRVRLAATLNVVRAVCEKEYRLSADSAALSVSYRIRSLESKPFYFLFKQHFPVRLTPGCRLLLPGGMAELVDPAFGNLLPGAGPFAWPLATTHAGVVDLQHIPEPADRQREFLYVRQLPEGWCGVQDVRGRAAMRMIFDRQKLPFLWLFLAYGGWNNVHTAVLEPCTNLPKDLAEASRLGQSARLDPGAVFETTVTVSLEAGAAGNADG